MGSFAKLMRPRKVESNHSPTFSGYSQMKPRDGKLPKDSANENSNKKHNVSNELTAIPKWRDRLSENLLCLVLVSNSVWHHHSGIDLETTTCLINTTLKSRHLRALIENGICSKKILRKGLPQFLYRPHYYSDHTCGTSLPLLKQNLEMLTNYLGALWSVLA